MQRACDNAISGILASLKRELIGHKTFRTKTEERVAVYTWIAG